MRIYSIRNLDPATQMDGNGLTGPMINDPLSDLKNVTFLREFFAVKFLLAVSSFSNSPKNFLFQITLDPLKNIHLSSLVEG